MEGEVRQETLVIGGFRYFFELVASKTAAKLFHTNRGCAEVFRTCLSCEPGFLNASAVSALACCNLAISASTFALNASTALFCAIQFSSCLRLRILFKLIARSKATNELLLQTNRRCVKVITQSLWIQMRITKHLGGKRPGLL